MPDLMRSAPPSTACAVSATLTTADLSSSSYAPRTRSGARAHASNIARTATPPPRCRAAAPVVPQSAPRLDLFALLQEWFPRDESSLVRPSQCLSSILARLDLFSHHLARVVRHLEAALLLDVLSVDAAVDGMSWSWFTVMHPNR